METVYKIFLIFRDRFVTRRLWKNCVVLLCQVKPKPSEHWCSIIIRRLWLTILCWNSKNAGMLHLLSLWILVPIQGRWNEDREACGAEVLGPGAEESLEDMSECSNSRRQRDRKNASLSMKFNLFLQSAEFSWCLHIYIYIFRHILGAVFSATHAAWLQKYHGRQVLNCWKLMGKQDLELNRWEMVKVDWVGECTIEFSKTCDGCTTCIWRGPYIQGMRQEAHVILYQQTTKIAGNIHGHAKMVVKIQKRRWLLAWCCAVQRCCATPRSFAWPSVKEIVLGCWDFGWGPGQRVYICIDYLCVVLYGVDRSSNIPCV